MARPDHDIDLGRGALLIAAHANPDLDVEAELAHLDDLATGAAPDDFNAWHHHVFTRLGFRGNAADYYDPRNSYLDDVVRRRVGIPITLAVVGMEIGRRLGVTLEGIGMPGHFLLRHARPEGLVYVDPFDGGLLDEAGCRARFEQVYGGRLPFHDSFLGPAGPRAILGRMLLNVENAFRRRRDLASAAWAAGLRLSVPGVSERN